MVSQQAAAVFDAFDLLSRRAPARPTKARQIPDTVHAWPRVACMEASGSVTLGLSGRQPVDSTGQQQGARKTRLAPAGLAAWSAGAVQTLREMGTGLMFIVQWCCPLRLCRWKWL